MKCSHATQCTVYLCDYVYFHILLRQLCGMYETPDCHHNRGSSSNNSDNEVLGIVVTVMAVEKKYSIYGLVIPIIILDVYRNVHVKV